MRLISISMGTNDRMINLRTMRDVLIEEIYKEMSKNDKIFFLSADFGAPGLDKLRVEFKDRFINVGIAEQNLMNVSCGLALEGFIVYCYGIVPFITMRCYEQIRNNLSMLSHLRKLNVNIIGVGAGFSYNLSGPSHQSYEDISIMRTLPNVMVFSPSDTVVVKKIVAATINVNKPKYIRLDGQPLPQIYDTEDNISLDKGFCELTCGGEVLIIATGFMVHTALKVVYTLEKRGIKVGLIDVFSLSVLDEDLLIDEVKNYKIIITLEEGFINRGGLDMLIMGILNKKSICRKIINLGFPNKYSFAVGSRKYLHKLNGLDEESIIKTILAFHKEVKLE